MQALASTHTILQPYYRMTPGRGPRAVSYRENVREDYREDYTDTVTIRGTTGTIQ